jgi:serine phosphatase RsbU (regulator of sigma subunit)
VTVGGAGPGGRHRGLEADYAEALDGYLGAPDERGLAAAYELGHRAVEAGVGLLELVGIHHRAVERVAPDLATRARLGDAAAFLAESLSTYEMAQRGYREARERAVWLHQLALTLQRSLLPAVPPATDGLEVAVRYLPAGPEVEVGGDWYDVVHRDGGRVALVVGDVMGHGIQQAAVMGQVRMGLRAYLLEGHPVDEVVRRSDALLATMAEAQTATLVLGLVTPGAGTMTLANAGHPPALLVDPRGRARFVEGRHGRLLGLPGEGTWPVDGPIALDDGTCVLLYTDGLLERAERAGEDGLSALRAAAEGHTGAPAALCDRVTEALVAGEPRQDDVCLLAFRRDPSG